MKFKELIDIKEAAKYCYMSVDTIRRRIKAGKIRPLMPAKKFLFTYEQLDRYIESTRRITTRSRS